MPKGDGKDKFYRTLELDAETKKIMTFFRNIKKKMVDDEVGQGE